MRLQAKVRTAATAAMALAVLVAAAAMTPATAATPAETAKPPAAPKKSAPTASAQKAPAGSQGAEVVARVNGAPLLRRDFDLAVQVEFRRRGPGMRGHADLQAVREAVLDALVDNELLYQKASQAGIKVTDAETRDEVARLKGLLGTPAEAAAFMKGAGLGDKELADQVRRTLIVGRFVDRDVAPGIAVTEKDARAWYDAHLDVVTRPESVHVSQILVRIPQGAGAAERGAARQKIEAILKELQGGKEFGEMARLHSEAPEAKKDGDSGWVWAGGGALPSVERAALALQPGEMSDIVESRRGFHIIKAAERRPAGPIPFEEARDTIVARLKGEQRQGRIKEYVAGLRQGARIEKLL